MQNPDGSILALDVGEKRIGVAVAGAAARLPRPLTTLEHTANVGANIQKLIDEHQASIVVVGLPRGLSGQPTAQTAAVQAFVAELRAVLKVQLHWQDEAVTSRQAETELQRRGKPYKKGDIDALAATYILEDFLQDQALEKRV